MVRLSKALLLRMPLLVFADTSYLGEEIGSTRFCCPVPMSNLLIKGWIGFGEKLPSEETKTLLPIKPMPSVSDVSAAKGGGLPIVLTAVGTSTPVKVPELTLGRVRV